MSEDESTSNEAVPDDNPETLPENSPQSFSSPVAGFWQRVAAFILDILLLAIIGQIICWPTVSFWFSIGPYGRIIGLVIVLLYFGIMNSRIGKGQTLGKRLLRIAVRNKEKQPISFGRSLGRIAILAFPAMLNGWALPELQQGVLQWLAGFIVFGIGAAIVYTIIFNRSSRQGLHDLICGTYVVNLKKEPFDAFPQASKKHWVVSGILAFLAIIVITASTMFGSKLIDSLNMGDASTIQAELMDNNRFYSVGVEQKITRIIGGNITIVGDTTSSIIVNAWYKGLPSEEERTVIANDIARVVLENMQNIKQFDRLSITVVSKFDIGIASGHESYSDTKSIDEWRSEIGFTSIR